MRPRIRLPSVRRSMPRSAHTSETSTKRSGCSGSRARVGKPARDRLKRSTSKASKRSLPPKRAGEGNSGSGSIVQPRLFMTIGCIQHILTNYKQFFRLALDRLVCYKLLGEKQSFKNGVFSGAVSRCARASWLVAVRPCQGVKGLACCYRRDRRRNAHGLRSYDARYLEGIRRRGHRIL